MGHMETASNDPISFANITTGNLAATLAFGRLLFDEPFCDGRPLPSLRSEFFTAYFIVRHKEMLKLTH